MVITVSQTGHDMGTVFNKQKHLQVVTLLRTLNRHRTWNFLFQRIQNLLQILDFSFVFYRCNPKGVKLVMSN